MDLSPLRNTIAGLVAALSMYTRLPAWRLMRLRKDDYARAISWWPLTGLLTGGLMACIVWGLSPYLPQVIVVILALVARIILTGAFHEDGLGDFFDGFGGGRTRERVLEIMKDSHIGSYAVVGYILYYMLAVGILSYIPLSALPTVLVMSDMLGRALSSAQVYWLKYARTEATSKTGVVYRWGNGIGFASTIVIAIADIRCLPGDMALYIFPPAVLSALLLQMYIYKRIGGYTGDTLGAVYLLLELVLYFSAYIGLMHPL